MVEVRKMERDQVIGGIAAMIMWSKHMQEVGWRGDMEMHRDYEEILRNALRFIKEREWNLITEDDNGILHGLPGDDGQYFMTDGKEIWIDEYVDDVADGIILDSGRDIREIMAWMYMPELPKQDRK